MNLIDKNEKFPDNCCQQDLTTLLTTCVGYTKIIRSPPPPPSLSPIREKQKNKTKTVSTCYRFVGSVPGKCTTRPVKPELTHRVIRTIKVKNRGGPARDSSHDREIRRPRTASEANPPDPQILDGPTPRDIPRGTGALRPPQLLCR